MDSPVPLGSVTPATRWLRLRLWLSSVFWLPDRRPFIIECPGAGRAASFHLEITTASELRVSAVVLVDEDTGVASNFDFDVNRASLCPPEPVDEFGLHAFVEVAPERTGATSQAAVTSLIVAGLLWAGYLSDLGAAAPEPAVSLLVAGAGAVLRSQRDARRAPTRQAHLLMGSVLADGRDHRWSDGVSEPCARDPRRAPDGGVAVGGDRLHRRGGSAPLDCDPIARVGSRRWESRRSCDYSCQWSHPVQKKIRTQGAYVIKSAESRPPRNRTTTTHGRAAQPNTADRRAALALQKQKQR